MCLFLLSTVFVHIPNVRTLATRRHPLPHHAATAPRRQTPFRPTAVSPATATHVRRMSTSTLFCIQLFAVRGRRRSPKKGDFSSHEGNMYTMLSWLPAAPSDRWCSLSISRPCPCHRRAEFEHHEHAQPLHRNSPRACRARPGQCCSSSVGGGPCPPPPVSLSCPSPKLAGH